MAPEPTKKSTQRRKKAAVLGVAGIVGIGAALTMANWTDEEFAGADLEAGDFDLQIATTAAGESPGEGDWVTGTTLEAFEDLEIMTGPWGPGDYDESDVYVRLDPETTTHDAQLTIERTTDTAAAWNITGPDSVEQEVLGVGEVRYFPVTVAMSEDASGEFQNAEGSVVWTFTAEQQPNMPEADDEDEG